MHDLVICTRNRPDELLIALRSIGRQSRLPAGVIVVDASDDERSAAVLEHWKDEIATAGISVTRVAANPCLPAQRNLAARLSVADVLHFIDDDVTLDCAYLAEIARVFENDRLHRILGVGGLIQNQPPHRPRLWRRLAMLDSKLEGVVLRSGINVMVTAAKEPRYVDWLSGCSMSYRRDVVLEHKFDESLAGYALMEDVDFGYRSHHDGSLVLQPHATLVHHVSENGRWDHKQRQRTAIYRRGWFVRKNLTPSAMLAFWWSVVASITVDALLAMATGRRHGLRVALWQICGAADFLKGSR
jgi:GT2 family glycosyltransferase